MPTIKAPKKPVKLLPKDSPASSREASPVSSREASPVSSREASPVSSREASPVSSPKKAEKKSPKKAEKKSPKKAEKKSPKKSPKKAGKKKKAPKKKKSLKVTLWDWQKPHYKRVKEILQNNAMYIDNSETGTGKTHIVGKIAQKFGYKLLVICPASLVVKWEKFCDDYAIETIDIISYETLRSRRDAQPKHGLLKRKDIKEEDRIVTTFTPTKKYKKLLDENMLIVFEEAHRLKNDSDQSKAARALTNALIFEEGTLSRFCMISATPFDKEEHVINMLRLTGFITNRRLGIIRKGGAPKLLGAEELRAHCEDFDKETTEQIMNEKYINNQAELSNLCYRLYVNIIQDRIVSAMPGKASNSDIKNGYYRVEEPEKLKKAIIDLTKAVAYNAKTDEVNHKEKDIKALKPILTRIELLKKDIFVRETRRILETVPHSKVIIFCNSITSNGGKDKGLLPLLAEELAEWKPLLLYGKTEKKVEMPNIIKKFQAPNDKYRLLISNPVVGGVGIDLDDTDGNYPRYMFISPTYDIQTMHQAVGRTNRGNTQSESVIRVVYGDVGKKEMSILKALSRKSDVYKDTLEQQVADGVLFPGFYPDYYETEA